MFCYCRKCYPGAYPSKWLNRSAVRHHLKDDYSHLEDQAGNYYSTEAYIGNIQDGINKTRQSLAEYEGLYIFFTIINCADHMKFQVRFYR